MDSTTTELAHDFYPFLRVYKDGRVKKLYESDYLPPSNDHKSGSVRSKDVVISPETNVSARLFLPKTIKPDQKLPLLIYVHGGAFVVGSAFSSIYHNNLTSLVSESNVIAVSVEYRLAPEHFLPACYDDTWSVVQWVASHNDGHGDEPWLNDHADFERVFLAGDSSGANIAHYMVVRDGLSRLGFGGKLAGLILIHPFFGKIEDIKFWEYLCPDTSGYDDPRLNPCSNPGLLAKLVCPKVLVFIAERDFIRECGLRYYEALRKSEWQGVVEIMETEGEGHVFHLKKPNSEKARILVKRVASFLNK